MVLIRHFLIVFATSVLGILCLQENVWKRESASKAWLLLAYQYASNNWCDREIFFVCILEYWSQTKDAKFCQSQARSVDKQWSDSCDESDSNWLFSGDSNIAQQDYEVDVYVKIKIGSARRLRFDVLNFWFSQHQLINLKLFSFNFCTSQHPLRNQKECFQGPTWLFPNSELDCWRECQNIDIYLCKSGGRNGTRFRLVACTFKLLNK